jgi:glyoxylase-like metal-dependent hydrolase (beta-lactamase superfamily II)
MPAIRQPGEINGNTTLIDIGMKDVYGFAAVYLVRGARTCLIDGGTHEEAPRLVELLGELGAFPPDRIVVTHPHWDHSQGIPLLRQAAARQGKRIEVLASAAAVPLLADAAFNDVYGGGPYQSIRDVTPLREGDALDLGGVTLRIYDAPGHCRGLIAILDEVNRNLFVGDALGYKLRDDIFLPPFMPGWEPDAFLASVAKLRGLPYETLCVAHFGCLTGAEARGILDESVETYRVWWRFFGRHADTLDDTDALLRAMREEINPGVFALRPVTTRVRVLLGLVMAAGSLTGRKTAIADKLALGKFVSWLATGYRMYTQESQA